MATDIRGAPPTKSFVERAGCGHDDVMGSKTRGRWLIGTAGSLVLAAVAAWDAISGSDNAELVACSDVGTAQSDCIPVDITQSGMSGAESAYLPGWQFCFTHTAQGRRLSDQGYG